MGWLWWADLGKQVHGISLVPVCPYPGEYSGFLPQTKDMQVRLIRDSKLRNCVNVCMTVCLSLYVSPVMKWQLVHGVPRPCPMSAGTGSSKGKVVTDNE